MVSLASLPVPQEVIASKYQVVRMLGQGAMGAVFEAKHTLTGKRFAIKWMMPGLAEDPASVKRFQREAQIAGAVDHPNVLEVFDVGEADDGSLFLVMEFLQGTTLEHRMRMGRMSPNDIFDILAPILDGLAKAHQEGIVHRDLKPENIFLAVPKMAKSQGGGMQVIPKLLDFGISKMTEGTRLTATGILMGTPYYMAPEQTLGAKHVDHRVDLYAIGAIIYEALTGRTVVQAESIPEIFVALQTQEPTPLLEIDPSIPADFAAVVMRTLSKDPAARDQTALALKMSLEQALPGFESHGFEATVHGLDEGIMNLFAGVDRLTGSDTLPSGEVPLHDDDGMPPRYPHPIPGAYPGMHPGYPPGMMPAGYPPGAMPPGAYPNVTYGTSNGTLSSPGTSMWMKAALVVGGIGIAFMIGLAWRIWQKVDRPVAEPTPVVTPVAPAGNLTVEPPSWLGMGMSTEADDPNTAESSEVMAAGAVESPDGAEERTEADEPDEVEEPPAAASPMGMRRSRPRMVARPSATTDEASTPMTSSMMVGRLGAMSSFEALSGG